MRILVCGDREWSDWEMILQELSVYPTDTVIIEGEARGADRLAGQVAVELGFQVIRFPADWKKYGRGAGPIRNQQMLDEGRPDLIIAFHDDLEHSRGTLDMVMKARKAGIQIIHRRHEA